MTETELLTKIITGTVTNEDFLKISGNPTEIIKRNRSLLYAFGIDSNWNGTMFGPTSRTVFTHELVIRNNKYCLIEFNKSI